MCTQMTKKFKLNVPVFTDIYITVVFTDNYEAFVKKNIKEHYKEDDMDEDGAYYVCEDGREFMVFDITSFREQDTIVHECVHAAAAILMNLGITLVKENEETYANTIEFMFSKINKNWKKVKEKYNKDGDTSKSKSGQVLPDVSGTNKSGA